MPQIISCNLTKCPFNVEKFKQSKLGKVSYRSCNIKPLSIYDGQCEYLSAQRHSEVLMAKKRIDAKEKIEAIQSELRNPEYFENLQRNREARGE